MRGADLSCTFTFKLGFGGFVDTGLGNANIDNYCYTRLSARLLVNGTR